MQGRNRGARKHSFSFEHDGHEVKGFVKELDDSITFTLNRLLSESARLAGNYDPDLAQFAVLREAVESLKIDGKTYAVGKTNKPIPRYYDQDSEKTVLEAVLGYVIEKNPFLIEEDRYREAFEDYALDDDVPESNPTELPVKRGQTG